MTDTITLPSGLEVYEGKVLVLPGASTIMPTGDLTPSEVQALRADIADIQDMELGDLANVTETGKATGRLLAVQADGSWAPIANLRGLDRVRSGETEISTDVVAIYAEEPVRFGPSGTAGAAWLRIAMGSSGSQDVVARADHVHPPTRKGVFTFNKSAAVLGAGASELVNQSVPTLVGGVTYDIDVVGTLEAVNTNTSGRLTLFIQIGSAGTIHSIERGFSGGVWTSVNIHGSQMSVVGGPSLDVRFWVEYSSGDPTALYSGQLAITAAPRGGQP